MTDILSFDPAPTRRCTKCGVRRALTEFACRGLIRRPICQPCDQAYEAQRRTRRKMSGIRKYIGVTRH